MRLRVLSRDSPSVASRAVLYIIVLYIPLYIDPKPRVLKRPNCSVAVASVCRVLCYCVNDGRGALVRSVISFVKSREQNEKKNRLSPISV